VMSSAGRWKLFRDQAERGSEIGQILFGFIAESVLTIIPESCSGSSRNGVRNHSGIASECQWHPRVKVLAIVGQRKLHGSFDVTPTSQNTATG
jgi:hypothetical protein